MTRRRPTSRAGRIAAICAACWLAAPASGATDSSIEGRRLVIVDGGSSGRSKVVFSAKGAGIAKGSATDPAGIAATVEIARGEIAGGFLVPAGSFSATGHGWQNNDTTAARYLNRDAASGAPTGVRTLLLKSAKSLRVLGRTLGDTAIDLTAMGAGSSGISVVVTITNGAEVRRLCTLFPSSEVKFAGPSASGRSKLKARRGVATSCPGLELAPTPALPSAPTAPYLYFDGNDVNDLNALAARVSDPATAGFLTSFHSFVDGALPSLGSASDDSRSRVAKAAALLHVLGQTPPLASGFTTYGEVAVTALLGMVDRTPLDSVDKFLNPPANLLNVLQDSGRLQSISEAYDLLRAATVAPSDDNDVRELIASWADAFVEDWNLIGDTFGLFAGHRDNWGIKGGAALVTAALALPDHPSATTWMASGMTFLNESLREVVNAPGWYSESPHYVNYSLNNLASTAWQVRHATSVDWFDDLAPLVDTALALRQPDGEAAPFEEGLANVFPHDVLAAAYPTRAPQMLWAWEESSQNPGNYDNQQIHSVTRFLVVDTTTNPTAPTGPATVFLDGDTHAVALRSGWAADATQLTSITAVDHADAEVFESRHNTENPLDLTLFAAGATLLPTASGGPQVTSSANRAYYLEPSSKNIPLVDNDAPYLLDPLAISFGERLDSVDSAGVSHDLLDSATTEVAEHAPGVTVSRTVALVENAYGVVVDRFQSLSSHDYATTWRGRGDATPRSMTPSHVAVDYAWPSTASASAHLAIDIAAGTGITGIVDTGFYAPAWGIEETLSPLRASTSAAGVHMLTVLRPRLDAAPASTIASIGSGDLAAFRVGDLDGELVIASRGGLAFSVDGVTSDAHLAVVRRQSGNATALGMVSGTTIEAGASVESNRAVTLSVSTDSGTAVVSLSTDLKEATRLTLSDLATMDGGAEHLATFDGIPLAGAAFSQSGPQFQIRVPHGGTVVIQPAQ